jgi:hypothetical protein
MTFDEVAARWVWKPIRNCPGRFLLGESPSALRPQDLAGPQTLFSEFVVATARHPVVIGRLDDGGLISYRRDNTYVHTLNTPEGFKRKLIQLGITLASPVPVNPDHQSE